MAKNGMEPNRERLVALVLLLQWAYTHGPLTQDEIIRELKITQYPIQKGHSKVPAYEGAESAVRQMFERDKRAIRELGFQIETVANSRSEEAYQIDPSSAYAPLIEFTPEEYRLVRAALRFSGGGVNGVFSVFNELPASDASIETSRFLTPLMRAAKTKHVVSFDYQSKSNKKRVVEPLLIGVFDDISYLVARTCGEAEIKGYRINRITSMPQVQRETFSADETTYDTAERWRPEFAKSLEPLDVVVTTSEVYADLLSQQYKDFVVKVSGGERSEVTMRFDSPRAALRFVLDAADRVRLVSPKSLRKDLEAWLKKVNKAKAPSLEELNFKSASSNDVLGQTLALMHAVYASPDGISAEELATRFQMDVQKVQDIMESVATMQPMLEAHSDATNFPAHIYKEFDDLDDPDNDSGRYRVDLQSLSDDEDEPSPLMWHDLFELNVALREASRVYNDPAIFSAIEKIEEQTSSFVRFHSSVNEALLGEVEAAVTNKLQLKIEYVAGTSEVSEIRSIEPREVKVLNGHTYVRAFCTSRSDWRTFRIDRIKAILATGPATETRPADLVTNWLTQIGDTPVVVVMEPDIRWVFEPLPDAQWLSLSDGRHAVKFAISSPGFLDYLMLRAGSGAVVVTPEFSKAGHELAKKILEAL